MPDLYSLDLVNTNIGLRQYTTVVFKVGSTYYARKWDGTLLSSSTTCETVIQAAIDAQGTVFLANTETNANGNVSYAVSGSFAGFTIAENTRLMGDYGTFIEIPEGYNSFVFKITGGAESTGLKNLTINELGTAQRDWTGIKIEIAGSESLSYATIENIVMYSPSIGLELETSNSRWIESCTFRNITILDPVIGVLFDRQSGDIHRNMFEKINIIAHPTETTNGFKNIDNRGNIFIGCDVWDIATTSSEANIKSTASGTVIIGGMMTGDVGTFEDQGIGTLIVDKNTKAGSGLNVISRPDLAKMGTWDGSGATSGVSGLLDGRILDIVVGTGGSSAADDSTGIYRLFDTGATINSLNGNRWNTASMERSLNAYFKAGLYLVHNTNIRVFAGFTSSASAPASAADPLNGLSGVALWFDSAVSANWKIMHNDGSGASTTVDTTVAAATDTLYPIEIYAVNDSRFRFVFNGVTTNVTTDMPASTTDLSYWFYIENTTGASRQMRGYYVIIRNDK